MAAKKKTAKKPAKKPKPEVSLAQRRRSSGRGGRGR
jgi:hypothetical protein